MRPLMTHNLRSLVAEKFCYILHIIMAQNGNYATYYKTDRIFEIIIKT